MQVKPKLYPSYTQVIPKLYPSDTHTRTRKGRKKKGKEKRKEKGIYNSVKESFIFAHLSSLYISYNLLTQKVYTF